jgi:hypothetical protein
MLNTTPNAMPKAMLNTTPNAMLHLKPPVMLNTMPHATPDAVPNAINNRIITKKSIQSKRYPKLSSIALTMPTITIEMIKEKKDSSNNNFILLFLSKVSIDSVNVMGLHMHRYIR